MALMQQIKDRLSGVQTPQPSPMKPGEGLARSYA
jgi:hypothetical protein